MVVTYITEKLLVFVSRVVSRLHKPVRVIHGSVEAEPAIQRNLASAVKTALLLLPEKFSAAQFYITIAGLSYTGASLFGAKGWDSAATIHKPTV